MKKKILALIVASTLQSALPMGHKALTAYEIRERALNQTIGKRTPPILQRAADAIYSKDFYALGLNETATIVKCLNLLTHVDSNTELLARNAFFNLAEEFIAFDRRKLGLDFKPVLTNLLEYLQTHASDQTDENMLLNNYFFEKIRDSDSSENGPIQGIYSTVYFNLMNKIREDARKTVDTDFDIENSEQMVFCNIL